MEQVIEIASILGVAVAAGAQFPVFLMLPWLLVLWGGGAEMAEWLGGLGGPPAFILGTAILLGFALARPLPWLGQVWEGITGVAGILAAGMTPLLLVADESVPVFVVSAGAIVLASLIRFQRWGQGRLPALRGDPVTSLDRRIHRLSDSILAGGLVVAGVWVPPVVLVILPLWTLIILVMGRSSLVTAWFHLVLLMGFLRSLKRGPWWDTVSHIRVEGEGGRLEGPFRTIPILFPGTIGEHAQIGRLVLPGEGMAGEPRWFVPGNPIVGLRSRRAVLLPEAWEWKRTKLLGGHQVQLAGLEPFRVAIIPEGYPKTPPIFPGNADRL